MTTTAPTPAPTPAADRPDDAIIRTVDLTKVYAGADFRAVDELNLSVAAGEIFGLLGPNGAGKTTTAGMLDDPGRPDVGTGGRRRRRRRRPPGAGQAAHRHRLPDEHARPAADGLGEPLLPRPPLRHRGEGVPPDGRRAAGEVPAGEVGPGVGLRPVGRDGPAADGRPGHLPPAGRPLPRRADGRPRPAEPAGAVGDPPDAQRRRADGPADDALHGRGRPALRPGGDHGPRPDPRPRHPGPAQAERRGRHDRHGQGDRRSRRTGGGADRGHRRRDRQPAGRRRRRAARARGRPARSPASSPRPSRAGSRWPTCRWPSRAWRRSSST